MDFPIPEPVSLYLVYAKFDSVVTVVSLVLRPPLGQAVVRHPPRPGCWRGCQAAHGRLKGPSWAMMALASCIAGNVSTYYHPTSAAPMGGPADPQA